MDLRDENFDRLMRISRMGIPDSAIADTINAHLETKFTAAGMAEIRAFDAIAQKKMLLTKDHEQNFETLIGEIAVLISMQT